MDTRPTDALAYYARRAREFDEAFRASRRTEDETPESTVERDLRHRRDVCARAAYRIAVERMDRAVPQ